MKPKKHPKANLEKFSVLFMQLGLVFALFISYVGIENKTEKTSLFHEDVAFNQFVENPDQVVEITVEKPPVEKTVAPTVIIDSPTIIEDDDTTFLETVLKPDDIDAPVPVLKQLGDEEGLDDIIVDEVSFISVEEAPTYPGCTGSNEEKKACFSKMVQKLVSRKFNGDLAMELGLAPGKKRITVIFKIDTHGNIVEMKARAPHRALEIEAMRVVKLFPKMTPGKMQGRPVNVTYVLPILFRVE
ncbi:MAG: energy transducer TonB [Flavobacteriaceae bacterium]|nr:MAG: energy transducer TonB [Flavobacteriaceae bacterium]